MRKGSTCISASNGGMQVSAKATKYVGRRQLTLQCHSDEVRRREGMLACDVSCAQSSTWLVECDVTAATHHICKTDRWIAIVTADRARAG